MRQVVFKLLSFDKKLKKYLGIETPLYKAWWKAHSRQIQKELDNQLRIEIR